MYTLKTWQKEIDGVTWKIALQIDGEDISVRGNALASGDAEDDKACEDEILARLDAYDVWAWAFVVVQADATIDGRLYTGHDSLGGCSYKDGADFIAGDYFADMVKVAVDNAKQDLYSTIAAGKLAEKDREGVVHAEIGALADWQEGAP